MAQTAGDEDLFFELQTRGNLVQVQQEQQKHRIEVLDRKIAAAQARIIVLAKGRRDAGGLAMANSRAALLNSSNVKHSQPKTGVQASQESTRATNKVTRVLEHRLNRLRVRSDETEEDSAAIKREIDNLRRQRLQQDLIFDKIKVALDRQEVDMASTMEQSNVLYAELEEIEAKKEKLRLHEQEQIREQKATIARMGEQLAAFKADAAAKREEAVLAHMQGLQATSSGSFRLGEMDNEQEKAAKSRLQAVEKRIAMQKKTIAALDKRIQPLSDAFDMLMHDTKVYNIPGLIETLLTEEREIYSHFSYLQHMNRDITLAEQRLNDVRAAKRDFEREQEEAASAQESRMNKLMAERNRATQLSVEFGDREELSHDITVELLKRVKSIYVAIGCRPENEHTRVNSETGLPVDDWEPERDGLTVPSVQKYLGAIEERVTTIVQGYLKVLRAGALTGTPITVSAPTTLGTGGSSGRRPEAAGSFRAKSGVRTAIISVSEVDEMTAKLTRGPPTAFLPKGLKKWTVQLPATHLDDGDLHGLPDRPLTAQALVDAAVRELDAGHIALEARKPPRAKSTGKLQKGSSFSAGAQGKRRGADRGRLSVSHERGRAASQASLGPDAAARAKAGTDPLASSAKW